MPTVSSEILNVPTTYRITLDGIATYGLAHVITESMMSVVALYMLQQTDFNIPITQQLLTVTNVEDVITALGRVQFDNQHTLDEVFEGRHEALGRLAIQGLAAHVINETKTAETEYARQPQLSELTAIATKLGIAENTQVDQFLRRTIDTHLALRQWLVEDDRSMSEVSVHTLLENALTAIRHPNIGLALQGNQPDLAESVNENLQLPGGAQQVKVDADQGYIVPVESMNQALDVIAKHENLAMGVFFALLDAENFNGMLEALQDNWLGLANPEVQDIIEDTLRHDTAG